MNHRSRAGAIVATPLAALVALLAVPLFFAAGGSALPPVAVAGIPPRALVAYQDAGGWCEGLRWELLAAIGFVESGHGTTGGATIDEDGEALPWIFGIPLDGSPGIRALAIGPWLGWWGLTGPWQQAVGPMQFLPGTFDAWQVDGDEDGDANPHDVDDAVPTAANYLCQGADGAIDDERQALRRYNNSDAYVAKVLAHAEAIAAQGTVIGGLVCPVAGPVSFADTWGAPRSGGRTHKGVDMFAVAGTPVVAPTSGFAERTHNSLGGMSYRLWGDDGHFYYGAHLSAYGSGVGQVEAGTILGYVGTSGNAVNTPAHLHFEIHPIRQRGDPASPVNPTAAVAAACADLGAGIAISGGD